MHCVSLLLTLLCIDIATSTRVWLGPQMSVTVETLLKKTGFLSESCKPYKPLQCSLGNGASKLLRFDIGQNTETQVYFIAATMGDDYVSRFREFDAVALNIPGHSILNELIKKAEEYDTQQNDPEIGWLNGHMIDNVVERQEFEAAYTALKRNDSSKLQIFWPQRPDRVAGIYEEGGKYIFIAFTGIYENLKTPVEVVHKATNTKLIKRREYKFIETKGTLQNCAEDAEDDFLASFVRRCDFGYVALESLIEPNTVDVKKLKESVRACAMWVTKGDFDIQICTDSLEVEGLLLIGQYVDHPDIGIFIATDKKGNVKHVGAECPLKNATKDSNVYQKNAHRFREDVVQHGIGWFNNEETSLEHIQEYFSRQIKEVNIIKGYKPEALGLMPTEPNKKIATFCLIGKVNDKEDEFFYSIMHSELEGARVTLPIFFKTLREVYIEAYKYVLTNFRGLDILTWESPNLLGSIISGKSLEGILFQVKRDHGENVEVELFYKSLNGKLLLICSKRKNNLVAGYMHLISTSKEHTYGQNSEFELKDRGPLVAEKHNTEFFPLLLETMRIQAEAAWQKFEKEYIELERYSLRA